ncbi:zinc ribbon domain-containing protein [Candidatus Woesearchaeota archaeon]|nr:zinc ribbon domain-containing protein [Candidatus Woesearchaeota archaeon]
MANCATCGEEVSKGTKFCENCGERVVEEKPQEEFKIKKDYIPRKKIPKWFVITSLVLSFFTAVTILLGIFANALLPGMEEPVYLLAMFSLGFVGIVTLFYIFMIIFFKAKKYERGAALLPWLHLIFYAVGGAVLGIISNDIYQYQIGWTVFGMNAGINFILLCFGLYYLLREE